MSISKELVPRRIYEISEEKVERYLLNIQERYFEVVAENLDLRQQVSRLIQDQNRILQALEKAVVQLGQQKEDHQRLEHQIHTLTKNLFQYFSLENKDTNVTKTEEEMQNHLRKLFLDETLKK